MLNADMAMCFPISPALPPALPGTPQNCGPRVINRQSPGCNNPTATILARSPLATTSALCRSYAVATTAANAQFVNAFALAFTKMVTVGFSLDAPAGTLPTSNTKLGNLHSIDLATTCPTLVPQV